MILRLYGSAAVIHPRHSNWDRMISQFPEFAGSRQFFDLTIELVQTSCGTGIPVMRFVRSRGETEFVPFYKDMGIDGVNAYWRKKNTISIDGKPTGIFADEN